eukprot:1394619-Prymnesium_polylepis.1
MDDTCDDSPIPSSMLSARQSSRGSSHSDRGSPAWLGPLTASLARLESQQQLIMRKLRVIDSVAATSDADGVPPLQREASSSEHVGSKGGNNIDDELDEAIHWGKSRADARATDNKGAQPEDSTQTDEMFSAAIKKSSKKVEMHEMLDHDTQAAINAMKTQDAEIDALM